MRGGEEHDDAATFEKVTCTLLPSARIIGHCLGQRLSCPIVASAGVVALLLPCCVDCQGRAPTFACVNPGASCWGCPLLHEILPVQPEVRTPGVAPHAESGCPPQHRGPDSIAARPSIWTAAQCKGPALIYRENLQDRGTRSGHHSAGSDCCRPTRLASCRCRHRW